MPILGFTGRRARTAATLVTVGASVLTLLVSAGPSAAAAPEGAIRNAGAPNAIPGSYLVALKGGAAAGGVAARHGATIKQDYASLLPGFSATMSEAQAKQTAADPGVAYVEQDQIVRAVTDQSNPVWGLDRIDQRNCCGDGKYNYLTTASTVHAYVIDTGIRFSHTQFGGRATSGFDAVDGGMADDCNGHGTHVAGTIGGSTYGVAKAVRLVAVRVLDCAGSGSITDVIAGVQWVTNNAIKPAVANMSLGGAASSMLDSAVGASIAAGITYAIAAGNDNGASACGVSPARVGTAITVAATDRFDRRPGFSNIGTCVDIFAPGVGVKSAWGSGDDATATLDGTSMASPHVAGVAALYLAVHPNSTPGQVAAALVDYSTKGKVQNAGSGSPNRLLYRPKDPTVTFLGCSSFPPQTFSCSMGFAHNVGAVQIRWFVDGSYRSAFDNKTSINDLCFVSTTSVRVTISADNGGDFSTSGFPCEFNG